MSRARLLTLSAILMVAVAAGASGRAVYRAWVPPRTQYEFDTRLFFLQLKMRGLLPGVGWRDVVSRVGPRWTNGGYAGLARVVARGEPPCSTQWDTAMGRLWGGPNDGRELDLLVIEQLGGRLYDRAPAAMRAGDVVFDVGAHLGTFTRFALDRGASLVVAFEPRRANVACMERSFAAEIAAKRLVIVAEAAWSSAGVLHFDENGSSQTGHVVSAAAGRAIVQVPATTFDAAIARLGLPRVDFVKMDIEGAERHALLGGRDMLRRFRPRMAICTYHTPDDRTVIPRVVREANPEYRVFTRGAFQAYFY